jgi:hypothetical protein
VGSLKFGKDETEAVYNELYKLGVGFDSRDIKAMMQAQGEGVAMLSGSAMDDYQPSVTTPSISTPVQFLQEWLPGFVFVVTKARKIDDLVGVTTQGRWEDEQIVQGVMEHSGEAVAYGDYANIPLSSWNTNFETRTVVRFEEGLSVGRLEEARSSAMRVSSAESKRKAAAESLEIKRNEVGFYGYNQAGGTLSGTPQNRTFGFLNDPNLPAYVTVATGASGFTEWSTKTYLEITADIRSWFSALRIQSGSRIDPANEPMTLALPTSAVDFLSVTSDFGNSVRQWLSETYPQTRVVSAPELDAANGGENVAYLYAEGINDESTDDSRTWVQVVPTKFQSLGVEQKAKRYVEDYSNATSGVMLKRPFAVYRASGI